MSFCNLLFDNLQDLHGASLDANAAGNALGCGTLGLQNHNLHGASLYTSTAADAQLLVDHVHTGLGILGNGPVLAGFHALATLDAHIGLSSATLGHNADAAQVLVKILVECLGAGLNTLQAGHTFGIFLNNELLHRKEFSFFINFYHTLYIIKRKNQRFFMLRFFPA